MLSSEGRVGLISGANRGIGLAIARTLYDAGFTKVLSYFEEFDDEGDGTGNFILDERGEPCESWLAYLIALR